MIYNVLDTEAHANRLQEYDFQKHIAHHETAGACDEWLNATTSWFVPAPRDTDNKWVTLVCNESDSKYLKLLILNDSFDVISQDQYDVLGVFEKTLYFEVVKEEINTGGTWFPQPEEDF